jgi:hypothetical protein
MAQPATSLQDLPVELILEVVRHLGCIRSHDPQSTAFKEKEQEKARQCENHARQLALHSLCLTCHRLRTIATPTLYSSFVGSATWHGYAPLQLFHRTISSPNNATGLKIRLADSLQYVENRLSDYLGNSLYDDTEFYGAIHMVAQYFYLLADIVRLAPNLQHLSVVSLETDEVSFWNYLLPGNLGTWAPPVSSQVASHGLPKLQTLCFQIHTEGYGFGPDAAWFRRICSAMTSVSPLSDLRASGVMTSATTLPLFGSFKNLQRLDITECVLDFEEVVDIWKACGGLRHIVAEWAFLNCGGEAPSDLYPGLLQHAKTLETLHLDMREVRFNNALAASPQILGSLKSFEVLESLAICETALLGNTFPLLDFPDQALEYGIAELMPFALKSFALLVHSDYGYETDCRLDEAFALWHLAEDCVRSLPKLEEVSVISGYRLSAPNVTKAFEEVGKRFRLVKEATLQASN